MILTAQQKFIGYEILKNEEECDLLCKELINEAYIAIDTEFFQVNNQFKLSLIQIASSKGNFILDLDFSENNIPLSLHNVLEDKNIIKVFHGHQQDADILYKHFKIKIKSLFDSQIAMMFFHIEAIYSYQQLVEEFLKIKIDKTHQMNDWQARPLSKEQLDYAAFDVFYLYKIYPMIIEKLNKKKRLYWAKAYMEEVPHYKKDKTKLDEYIIKYKVNVTTKLQHHRLDMLLKMIHEENPPLIPENYLKNIVEAKNLTINRIEHILSDAKHKVENCMMEKILEIIKSEPSKEILECIELPNEKKIELNHEESHIFIILKYLLRNVSHEYHIAARLIAEKKDLLDLIYKKKSRVQIGWRFEVFGKVAISLLRGEKSITIVDNALVIK